MLGARLPSPHIRREGSMLAPTPLRSVEALLADDPAALDDAGLRENLAELARLRARIDAAEATTIVEFDRRDAYVADGMVATKTWLVHHTGVASDTAGARTARATKGVRHMPLLAAALAGAEVTVDHVRALTRCLRRSPFGAVVRDHAMLTENAIAFDDDGTPVPQQVLQQWACDSAVGRVVMSARSIPFDLGKITYTATDGQRRILAARDRGCVVPGCKRKARWCEAHHIIPWPHGPTNIRNLVLLCRRHHKQVHH